MILLGLVLSLPSASVSSVFMVLYIYVPIKKFLLTSFSLPFSELSLVGLALDVSCLTVILQCCDAVG